MRPFRHLTPSYILDRALERYYRMRHPDLPWLTPEANRILASCLRQSDTGLEFGSGRSTLWFARHTRRLTSVEHDAGWYRKVEQLLFAEGLDNVDYHLVPVDAPGERGGESAYVRTIERIPGESLDYALVDGKYRDYCALNALPKLRPGGLLVIDNANRYLPCDSRAPNSRSRAQGALGEVWAQVEQQLQAYRAIWTTSGVADTALFFKPCG